MDDNNDYTYAGKGRKRRERLEHFARQIEPKPDRGEIKAPTRQKEPEFRDVSGSELKTAIRLLTLKHDTFTNVSDALRRKGYRASGLTISAVRAEMKQIVKLLIDEGLLDAQRLEDRSQENKTR